MRQIHAYICTLQHEWMFGAYSETDVTDGGTDVLLPVTRMDRVMLEQAENIGNALSLAMSCEYSITVPR